MALTPWAPAWHHAFLGVGYTRVEAPIPIPNPSAVAWVEVRAVGTALVDFLGLDEGAVSPNVGFLISAEGPGYSGWAGPVSAPDGVATPFDVTGRVDIPEGVTPAVTGFHLDPTAYFFTHAGLDFTQTSSFGDGFLTDSLTPDGHYRLYSGLQFWLAYGYHGGGWQVGEDVIAM